MIAIMSEDNNKLKNFIFIIILIILIIVLLAAIVIGDIVLMHSFDRVIDASHIRDYL